MRIKKDIPEFYLMPKKVMEFEISNGAKLLLMVLFSNGGFDVQEFTRAEAQEILNISKQTAIKTFKELVAAGLIIDERQGLNQPNLIRVIESAIMEGWE